MIKKEKQHGVRCDLTLNPQAYYEIYPDGIKIYRYKDMGNKTREEINEYRQRMKSVRS